MKQPIPRPGSLAVFHRSYRPPFQTARSIGQFMAGASAQVAEVVVVSIRKGRIVPAALDAGWCHTGLPVGSLTALRSPKPRTPLREPK